MRRGDSDLRSSRGVIRNGHISENLPDAPRLPLPNREIPVRDPLPAGKADLRPAPFIDEVTLLNRAQTSRGSRRRATELGDPNPHVVLNSRGPFTHSPAAVQSTAFSA